MTQSIQASAIQIDELESRFGLQEALDNQFFPEWQDDLPELGDWEKESLDRLKAGYLNLLKKPPLLENAVRMAVLHPLLFIAGFYLSPFQVKPEKSVSISLPEEDGLIIEGRIDALVLKEQFWLIVIESKRAGISLEEGIAQLLAYMLGTPNPEKPNKKQLQQKAKVESCHQVNDSENTFSTHRSLIAGCTDYSYLTLEVIMNDLDRWLRRLIQVQEYLNKSTQELKEASYWSNVSVSVKSLFEKSTLFYRTSIEEITEILSEIQSEIKSYHVSRLRRICQVATELNYEYGQIWHGKDNFKEYGNPHFRVLEGMYAEGRDMSVSLLDLGNAAERLSDFVGKKY